MTTGRMIPSGTNNPPTKVSTNRCSDTHYMQQIGKGFQRQLNCFLKIQSWQKNKIKYHDVRVIGLQISM
jgi:hypothetical protein